MSVAFFRWSGLATDGAETRERTNDTSEGPKRIQNSARGEATSVSTLGVARREFYPENKSKASVQKEVFRALLEWGTHLVWVLRPVILLIRLRVS